MHPAGATTVVVMYPMDTFNIRLTVGKSFSEVLNTIRGKSGLLSLYQVQWLTDIRPRLAVPDVDVVTMCSCVRACVCACVCVCVCVMAGLQVNMRASMCDDY